MFDLAGIKAMGESIELFTTNTARQLTAIEHQLRIANELTAIDIAAHTQGSEQGIIELATERAARAYAKEPTNG